MNVHVREVICTSKARKGMGDGVGIGFQGSFGGRHWTQNTKSSLPHPLSASNSQDGETFWRLPEAYLRGNTVKYVRVPDEVLESVKAVEAAERGAGGGRGRGGGGRGRGGRGGARGGGGGGEGGGGRGRGAGEAQPEWA